MQKVSNYMKYGTNKPKRKNKAKISVQSKMRESLRLIERMQVGSAEHKKAKEVMLHIFASNVEKVSKVLLKKAMSGDIIAIKEFFDRTFGKAKETIDFNANVQLSLKDLARKRDALPDDVLSVANTASIVEVEAIPVD